MARARVFIDDNALLNLYSIIVGLKTGERKLTTNEAFDFLADNPGGPLGERPVSRSTIKRAYREACRLVATQIHTGVKEKTKEVVSVQLAGAQKLVDIATAMAKRGGIEPNREGYDDLGRRNPPPRTSDRQLRDYARGVCKEMLESVRDRLKDPDLKARECADLLGRVTETVATLETLVTDEEG